MLKNYPVASLFGIITMLSYYALDEKLLAHTHGYNDRMDTLTPRERSMQMAKVRSKNTKPEMLVRKLIYSLGYRYRLHQKDLPGKPDLVFKSRKRLIFVHGCFWHGHDCKMGDRLPKSRVDFWRDKIIRNRERDDINLKKLEELGWGILVLWECQLKDKELLSETIINFLDGNG